ncbi:hypothetical protein [Longimicrobium sp.]|uniref:hypothetical protein n=1 Tax=Longimicrobium sp. TaxID=2029185 RepID=UPI003B3B409E
MTKHLLRFAVAGAALFALHAPARAQDPLPAPLPWGINGAQVAAALEAKEIRVITIRAGRDVHAASANRHLQAIAILKSDSLVGLVYFHPENASLNAADLFTQASARTEQTHGPPFCRRSGLAVWTLDSMRIEVRLRRSVGDGAPGAEIRYMGPGYADEMSRRTSTARRARPRPPSTGRTSGPRLLGSPVPPPAAAEPDSAVSPPAPAAEAADVCTASA